ncbi:hypothetical protein EYF80_060634 [Liparis tanakae]|uniref:Uncharacterized protein n=1 Tax=Liparis tanakae TaxID=230148 RepID=A0A4Z2EKD2_9TELE|nr:hypothetical protein EYF80_060634 [Liparis tanakae]
MERRKTKRLPAAPIGRCTLEQSSCITRAGPPPRGAVKFATTAATGSRRSPSGPKQPGRSPKHAAWPNFPSLGGNPGSLRNHKWFFHVIPLRNRFRFQVPRVPGVQVQVELTELLPCLGVAGRVERHVLVPRGRALQPGVGHAQQLLVDGEQPLRHGVQREVLDQLVLVDGELDLLHAVHVVRQVPRGKAPVERQRRQGAVAPLQGQQKSDTLPAFPAMFISSTKSA